MAYFSETPIYPYASSREAPRNLRASPKFSFADGLPVSSHQTSLRRGPPCAPLKIHCTPYAPQRSLPMSLRAAAQHLEGRFPDPCSNILLLQSSQDRRLQGASLNHSSQASSMVVAGRLRLSARSPGKFTPYSLQAAFKPPWLQRALREPKFL